MLYLLFSLSGLSLKDLCLGFFKVVIMEERYESLKALGSGNYGVARLVKDKKTNELLAVKFIERGKKVRSFLLCV